MIRLIFILLFCSNFLVGQTISDKEYIIKYSIGHYNFGNSGEFEKVEIFKFKRNEKNFVLTEFQFITKKYIFNPETLENNKEVSDTIIKFQNKKIDNQEIESLVKELDNNKSNFNSEFFNSFLSKKISKNDVLKIAKNREEIFWFVDDETGKVDEFGKEKIKGIRNLNHFEEYIKSVNPNINEIKMVMDAWNFVDLGYLNSNSINRLDFHSILGQPIQQINNSSDRIQIINLNVNLILLKILPKESLLSKELKLENLKDSYINWYIENEKWKNDEKSMIP